MLKAKTVAINVFILLELVSFVLCKEIPAQENCCPETKANYTQTYERVADTGRALASDHHDAETPKAEKPWLGYYDFLITEGSYKFWVVFQLFTIAILIYSAFAAIYYAKYTINDYENYDDYLFGRSARSVRSVPETQTAFLGLPVETYLQIFNAIYNYGNKEN